MDLITLQDTLNSLFLLFFFTWTVTLKYLKLCVRVTCKRRQVLSANSQDLKFFEQHCHHRETLKPGFRRPPIINQDITQIHQVQCPECTGEVSYERDHDETVCTHCGLVISSSHRYVAGHRIYLPFIDDKPTPTEYDRVEWWRNFLINFNPFIYPDDRRYYGPE